MKSTDNDSNIGDPASGHPDNIPSGKKSTKNDIDKEETVSYETHKELLAQRKADQKRLREVEEELNQFKSKQKEIEENKLREKGEYQKLLETREKELSQIKEENAKIQQNLVDGRKLQAFNDRLPGKLKKKEYLAFVDLDKIPFNPETQKVDEAGLKMVVDEFVKEYPDLIQTTPGKKLPTDSASSHESLTYEQWLKLPVKDQRLRMKEIKK